MARGADGDWNLCLTGSPVGASLIGSRRNSNVKIAGRPNSAIGTRNQDTVSTIISVLHKLDCI